jgi:hypothetical protein
MSIKDTASFGAYVEGSPSDIEGKLGTKLAIQNQFFNWGDSIKSFLSGVGGRVPLATLEPWDYSLSAIDGGSADSYLRSVAADCQAFGKPVYLRPMHEFNGDWYPWSPNTGQEALFKSAWAHMAGILKVPGNVKLIWCPNADTVNRAEPENCFPSLVDVIGLDGYNWNGTSFESVFNGIYQRLTKLGGQDVWVCETACGESGEKPGWVNSMFASTKFPRMKAVVWFHTNKEKDWRIDSSSASLAAFKANLAGGVKPPDPPVPPGPPVPPIRPFRPFRPFATR